VARRLLDSARSGLPDVALRLWSSAFDDAVRCAIATEQYDAVQAEGIEMARYLAHAPSERRIYDAHNAEFLLQRRLAESQPWSASGAYSRIQWRRLERFEREVVTESALTLAVSQHDANQLLALSASGANVRVVPNGIDVSGYPFRAPLLQPPQALLFVGKLDFRPNAQALRWFIDQVLPSLPDVRLFAVGAEPPAWLVRAGQHDPRVVVTGYVEDERAYFARCAAMVLPLHAGGGSRLKALVAMASGVPIITTRFGMEGIDAEPSKDFLSAESASDWPPAIRRVLTDSELRSRLARSARTLVEERYDWSKLGARLRAAYADILT
jgi:glycosyltransferase involved in cell wall biosynthesis